MRSVFQFLEYSLTGGYSFSVKLLVWIGALLVAALLAIVRIATEAELSIMSAVILPVIAVAWMGGGRQGILFAAAATVMWVMSDYAAGRSYAETWMPVLNGVTRFAVYSVVAVLVGLLRDALRRERELARHDILTGLMNRRAFFQVGQDETERARRYGHPIAVAFLDLDNFKQLNDRLGHDVGDAALKLVAQIMERATRTTDRTARLGGDEFAIILPETGVDAAQEAGTKLADAINAALKKEFSPTSVSIGVACFDPPPEGFEPMVKAADVLMYKIKKGGKSGVLLRQFAHDSPGASEATPES